MNRLKVRLLIGLVVAVALAWGASPDMRAAAADAAKATVKAAATATAAAPAKATAAAPAAPQGRGKGGTVAGQQTQVTDAAGRKHPVMTKVTPAQRQAAANRVKAKAAAAGVQQPTTATLQAAGGAPETAMVAAAGLRAAQFGAMAAFPATAGAMPPPGVGSPYLVGSNGQLIPDYSGLTANWAYSPTPTVVPGGTVAIGNPLIARAYATDSATNVFGIVPTPLIAGTLQSFQAFIEPAAAGLMFHAFVLRPTGVPNDYLVVFDSGPLAVPAIGTAGIQNFPVAGGVAVNAGDVIAWYGQGISLDIGSGVDEVYYPAPAAPVQNGTITVGTGGFPVLAQARTYSFGATVLDPLTGTLTGGIRKFVDGLPGLGAANANNLGQYIPVASPTAPPAGVPNDADYYEIALVQYREQMHSDLPPVVGGKADPNATGGTLLRGYVQEVNGVPVSDPHYLGPLIMAQKGRPVRIKFTNRLPTGAGGNLFLPVDASVMGSGPGPNISDAIRTNNQPNDLCKTPFGQPVPAGCYAQNRATIHLHGGVTPWISDGTTHQWITPAGETTAYPKGVSVYNVPDMPNGGPNPPQGVQTFYYTNDQSARLMFYHDHAAGITRLNVYAGVAAGYLLTDPTEQELVAKGVIPVDQIPLVIQDKTFVDAANILVQDPTWNWGSGAASTFTDGKGNSMLLRAPVTGDLWWPHVYQPAQNPYDASGYNATGRWNYGPWFYPPTTGIAYGPIDNPYCVPAGGPCADPAQPVKVPGTPNPSWGAEAFLDTPVINGTLYPTLTVAPKAYRFRILNAAHDRFWNLQLFTAADKNSPTTAGTTGAVLCDASYAGSRADCTEVKMVPAAPGTGLPDNWPQDGRAGGVPDPATAGPSFYMIGTEGGFLPRPVKVDPQPVVWNGDPLTFNFGNVSDFSVLLGPAERADVIVDFSAFAGKTLILYNDAPAAFPALDPRNDYYTGNPDQFDTGGTGSTLPGYGPNIRTIMQIKVEGPAATAFDAAALMTAWAPVPGGPSGTPFTWSPAGVFEHAQDQIIVGQGVEPTTGFLGYNGVYTNNLTFRFDPPFGRGTIFTSDVNFETVGNYNAMLAAEPKSIHDEMGATFDEYGRMKASLGVENPNRTPAAANFIGQGYADPATEVLKLSSIATIIGDPLADGTQIWRITHNGVDTHPVHFHLFHVQVINRVGWDGAYRLPHPTELGWKDTVRISPLEDTYVAVRPIAPLPSILPFKVPNSFRPYGTGVVDRLYAELQQRRPARERDRAGPDEPGQQFRLGVRVALPHPQPRRERHDAGGGFHRDA